MMMWTFQQLFRGTTSFAPEHFDKDVCIWTSVCVCVQCSSCCSYNMSEPLSAPKQHGVPTWKATAGRFISVGSARWTVLLRGAGLSDRPAVRRLLILSSRAIFPLGGHEGYPATGPSITASADTHSAVGNWGTIGGGIVAASLPAPLPLMSEMQASLHLKGGGGSGWGGGFIVTPAWCQVSLILFRLHSIPPSSGLYRFLSPPLCLHVSLPRFSQCPTLLSPQDLYQGDGCAH